MSQASAPNSTNAMNAAQQASPARSTLSVAVVPTASDEPNGPPISSSLPLAPNTGDPQNLRFWPAKPCFSGWISRPEGKPSYVGGYSDVWRCGVQFSTPSEALPREVAVKVLRPVLLNDYNGSTASARFLQRFQQEAITWVELNHPNIVSLIGCTLTPSLSFISPWYQRGNLNRHLKNHSETEKLRLVLGIAKGLEYLHSRSPPVVHGDLKPENILLSDHGEPLLTDFGLSTILGEEAMYTPSHPFGGSTPWMSPECIRGESRLCQSDIYSFGSLAFKVMTGTSPHAGLTHYQITLNVCNSKYPVDDWSKYPQLQDSVKDLIKHCWAGLPNARPSMPEVVQRLTTLLDSYESEAHAAYSEPETARGWSLISIAVFAIFLIQTALCALAIQ
ncbi:hypothetical protein FRC04_011242 [Tulasnella sp. 424]|nr:hypothetical protein FRC04_011242 [Tulasnella sp. 424]